MYLVKNVLENQNFAVPSLQESIVYLPTKRIEEEMCGLFCRLLALL